MPHSRLHSCSSQCRAPLLPPGPPGVSSQLVVDLGLVIGRPDSRDVVRLVLGLHLSVELGRREELGRSLGLDGVVPAEVLVEGPVVLGSPEPDHPGCCGLDSTC